jgi:outer membrane protein assembly factor BamB
MKSLVVLVAALGIAAGQAQDSPRPSFETLTQQARAAREAGDFPSYLKAVEGLQAMLPWSPTVRYSMARAYALNGRKGEALAVLKALGDAGWGFDTAGDAVLAPLRDEAGFATVAQLLARNAQPRGAVRVWRKLPLAGKQPEGEAATDDGTLYVGALKDGIYQVGADAFMRLYQPEQGWGVVGLRVDAPRGELIACLSDEAAGTGRLVRLALPDLRERARADIPATAAFCNDSAVLSDGRVAFTDSTGGRLWIADRVGARQVPTDTPLIYPNGVAALDGRLYVAHAGGLRRVDPETGRSDEVTAAGTALIGIDGLIAGEDALYAVQNGTAPIRVLRIRPQPGGGAEVDVLASGHAILNGATTVARHRDRLIVLSQTGIPNGSLPDDPVLVEVPIEPYR